MHTFARAIGLKREWFQRACTVPHYDVTTELRLAALAAGAVAMNRRETVTIIRRWRALGIR